MVGLLDSHDTGKATIKKGGPLPVINGVTTVSRVIAPVTRLFSVFYWNSTYNDRLGDENSSPSGHRLDGLELGKHVFVFVAVYVLFFCCRDLTITL